MKEDEKLVSFKKDSVLCLTNSDLAQLPEVQSLPSWAALLLVMATENASPNSFWRPYLSIFPTKERITSPFYWDENKKDALLRGTVLESNEDCNEITQLWIDRIEPIIKLYPNRFSQVSYEDFLRMSAVMLAYSFDIEKTKSPISNENEKSAAETSIKEDKNGDAAKKNEGSANQDDEKLHSQSLVGNNCEVNSEDEFSDLESEVDPDELEKAMCPISDMFNGDDELCNVRTFEPQ